LVPLFFRIRVQGRPCNLFQKQILIYVISVSLGLFYHSNEHFTIQMKKGTNYFDTPQFVWTFREPWLSKDKGRIRNMKHINSFWINPLSSNSQGSQVCKGSIIYIIRVSKYLNKTMIFSNFHIEIKKLAIDRPRTFL
jgi:hypothetical protein